VLPWWAMQVYADPGDLICDPFGGSGTTARAAVKFGSQCILIEREERYCELAARSLGDIALQLKTETPNLFNQESADVPRSEGPE